MVGYVPRLICFLRRRLEFALSSISSGCERRFSAHFKGIYDAANVTLQCLNKLPITEIARLFFCAVIEPFFDAFFSPAVQSVGREIHELTLPSTRSRTPKPRKEGVVVRLSPWISTLSEAIPVISPFFPFPEMDRLLLLVSHPLQPTRIHHSDVQEGLLILANPGRR
jgi:hypothetical protein